MKILFKISKWGNQQPQQTEAATSQCIEGDAPPGFVSRPVSRFLEGYSHVTPHILSCHTVHFCVNIVLLLSLFNENRDFLMWKSSAYIIIPHCDYSWGQEGWSREQKEKWWAINLNSEREGETGLLMIATSAGPWGLPTGHATTSVWRMTRRYHGDPRKSIFG